MLAALLFAFLTSPRISLQAATVIYSSNFELGAGPEWSERKTSLTPIGYRQFLGGFGHGATNLLTLTNLPPHTALTVMFDLFVAKSWDGNQGPDIWDMREKGSPMAIMRTSFSDNLSRQAFPGSYGSGDYHRQTGAAEIDTLGYNFDYGNGLQAANAVYPIQRTFAHSSNSLTLAFSTSLEGTADESWGLDNFMVVVGDLPTVSLVGPMDNAAFSSPATVTILVNAAPGDEPLGRVELYGDQTLLRVWTNEPYFFEWTNLPAGMHSLRARAYSAGGLWKDTVAAVSVNGLKAEYFNNANLTGTPTIRRDAGINFNWGDASPIPGVGSGAFSSRWTGLMVPRFTEACSISTANDDGVRVWIAGQKIIDAWHAQVGAHTNQIALEAGKPYPIMVEYFDSVCCGAKMKLFWESAHQNREIIPQSQLFPPGSLPPALFIRPLGNSQFALDWSTNAANLRPATAATPSPGSWSTNVPILSMGVTNGMNRVVVNATNAAGYFRLQSQ